MVKWIQKELGVTTLRYQKIDDMVKAIGLPKEKLCLYCWTGDYQRFKFGIRRCGILISNSAFYIPQSNRSLNPYCYFEKRMTSPTLIPLAENQPLFISRA